MKTLVLRGQGLMNAVRRLPWVYDNLTPRKLRNLGHAAAAYVRKSEIASPFPVVLKIDLTPLCNLRCPVCVHADHGHNAVLKQQRFSADQSMKLGQFRRIVDEVSGVTSALSLYFLGDPLMHPDLDAICRLARDARLNTHVSSNFSFELSDERIVSLLTSGITHLTICLDGMSQENYARTRVGGRLERVLCNLVRLTRYRADMRLRYPHIEVQYVRFQHNDCELERARTFSRSLGVDRFTAFWGDVHNYTDVDPGTYRVFGPRESGILPRCSWPYMSMVIRYDGDVIPCCIHRLGAQFARDGDRRAVGNVFESGVAAVWNSAQYARTRRLVASPKEAESRGEAAGHFCRDCSRVYETDRAQIWRNGRHHTAPLVTELRRTRRQRVLSTS